MAELGKRSINNSTCIVHPFIEKLTVDCLLLTDKATKIALDRNRGLLTVENTKIIIKTYYYIKS